MAGAVAEEDQAHQAGADQDGEADAGDGRDHHVDRHRIAEALEVDEREQDGDDGDQRHPLHHPLVARPGDGGALEILRALVRNRVVLGHGFHLAPPHGIIKARVALC